MFGHFEPEEFMNAIERGGAGLLGQTPIALAIIILALVHPPAGRAKDHREVLRRSPTRLLPGLVCRQQEQTGSAVKSCKMSARQARLRPFALVSLSRETGLPELSCFAVALQRRGILPRHPVR